MYQDDPFWKDDIGILMDKARLIEFVPTSDMTTNEKLNAITRFLLYLGVLLTVIYKSSSYIYVPLIGMVLVYLIHEHYPMEQTGGAEQVILQTPTKENPFMNVLLTDYVDNPHRSPAADVEKKEVQEDIDKHFAKGLYRDINNIWDKNNSQRQFYTTPSTTIPNDRDSFMKWCWSTPYTCKDGNLTRCMKYEDVRRHGQIH